MVAGYDGALEAIGMGDPNKDSNGRANRPLTSPLKDKKGTSEKNAQKGGKQSVRPTTSMSMAIPMEALTSNANDNGEPWGNKKVNELYDWASRDEQKK